MSMRLRHATPADLPHVLRLLEAFDAYLNGLDQEGAAPLDAARLPRIERLAFSAEPVCQVLLAEQAEHVCGYIAYHWGAWFEDMAAALFVIDLFVEHEHRRKGVGRALMTEARRLARARGCSRLVWTVWRRNPLGQRFYDALGAEAFDELRLMSLAVDAP